MAIKTYSLKKDGKTYLAPCFQVKEFVCKASDTILISEVSGKASGVQRFVVRL